MRAKPSQVLLQFETGLGFPSGGSKAIFNFADRFLYGLDNFPHLGFLKFVELSVRQVSYSSNRYQGIVRAAFCELAEFVTLARTTFRRFGRVFLHLIVSLRFNDMQ